MREEERDGRREKQRPKGKEREKEKKYGDVEPQAINDGDEVVCGFLEVNSESEKALMAERLYSTEAFAQQSHTTAQ